ncbi:uncharacterized protein LOC124357603 isoform X2 [Homalodisca vitripennis]|uniref:uncharacterized protein LOC124357603 isoform X2 n=1 Tax=Homalodisca vitripennis TaxID=197043 RepID=UPI001EEC8496|nr:uncharacterized protein LOC124357603 isoform X2 [Homalodisca vitripennis]
MSDVRHLHPEKIKIGLQSFNKVQKYGIRAVATVLVHCASKNEDKKKSIEFPDSNNLTHEKLIQQACTATVNSTCQLLTCTLVALVDIAQKYKKSLMDQMSLMEESLTNLDNDSLQEELTDLITAIRSEVDTFRRNYMELNSLMEYVEKLVNSATETSFLAGAETACNALSERLYSAKTVIDDQDKCIKKLEQDLVRLQEAIINQSSKRKQPKDDSDREPQKNQKFTVAGLLLNGEWRATCSSKKTHLCAPRYCHTPGIYHVDPGKV